MVLGISAGCQVGAFHLRGAGSSRCHRGPRPWGNEAGDPCSGSCPHSPPDTSVCPDPRGIQLQAQNNRFQGPPTAPRQSCLRLVTMRNRTLQDVGRTVPGPRAPASFPAGESPPPRPSLGLRLSPSPSLPEAFIRPEFPVPQFKDFKAHSHLSLKTQWDTATLYQPSESKGSRGPEGLSYMPGQDRGLDASPGALSSPRWHTLTQDRWEAPAKCA